MGYAVTDISTTPTFARQLLGPVHAVLDLIGVAGWVICLLHRCHKTSGSQHSHRISRSASIAMKLAMVHQSLPSKVQLPSVQRAMPQRLQCVGTASTPTAVKMNQLDALKKVHS